jgi:hypothetical protein
MGRRMTLVGAILATMLSGSAVFGGDALTITAKENGLQFQMGNLAGLASKLALDIDGRQLLVQGTGDGLQFHLGSLAGSATNLSIDKDGRQLLLQGTKQLPVEMLRYDEDGKPVANLRATQISVDLALMDIAITGASAFKFTQPPAVR